jgi:hypothetical protein
MNHMLMNRAAVACAAIESAKTPMQKRLAEQEGLSVKQALEKQLADDAALAAFSKAKPQSMAGVWTAPINDHPVFMVAQPGTKITGPITLPDGSLAAPNPQYQIAVPLRFLDEMLRRGFIRANSVMTNLDTAMPAPPHLQHV